MMSDGASRASKRVVKAVAPERFEFDKTTLGARKYDEDRGHFRAVFEDSRLIGLAFAALKDLCDTFPMSIQPTGLSIQVVDRSEAILYIMHIPKDAFIVYENAIASDTTIVVSSVPFAQRRRWFTQNLTFTLAFQEVPREATMLFVQLYPRSGLKKDGIVRRFRLNTHDEEYRMFNAPSFNASYQHEITIPYLTLLRELSFFKSSAGAVVLQINNDSFDFSGRADEDTTQVARIPFVETSGIDGSNSIAIETALRANPESCFHRFVRPVSASEPADIENYRVSLIYFRRCVASMQGCKFIRIYMGRGYEKNNGEFLPMRFNHVNHSEVDGRELIQTDIYLCPEIESDN